MIESTWRFAYGSATGTSHLLNNQSCQDVADCRLLQSQRDGEILIAVVSDGAGSAKFAGDGASAACDIFIAQMDSLFRRGGSLRNAQEDFARSLVFQIRREISLLAEASERLIRDYACTLCAGVVGLDCGAFLQIGDGIAIVDDSDHQGSYAYVSWPQQGEYASSTRFITDDCIEDEMLFEVVHRRINEVALLTDGLVPISVNLRSQEVSGGFFNHMFTRMRTLPRGFSSSYSSSIMEFLKSPRVNERVSDDKTIVLASRDALAAPSVCRRQEVS
jgi:hypothetical protein